MIILIYLRLLLIFIETTKYLFLDNIWRNLWCIGQKRMLKLHLICNDNKKNLINWNWKKFNTERNNWISQTLNK